MKSIYSNRTKAIFAITMSSLGFALMSAFIKLSGPLPGMQKLLFKSIVTLIITMLMLKKYNLPFFGHSWENRKFLFIRAIFGTIGVWCSYYTLGKMVLSDANMLHKLSPFFLILLASFFLKEKANKRQLLAVIVAFSGALFIVKPSFTFAAIPALIGVIGGLFDAIAYTAVRFIRGKEEPYTIVFFFSLCSIVALAPFVYYSYHAMTNFQIFCLFAAGIFASVGQLGMTYTFKFAPAKEISIFDYSNIAFSAIISMVVFGTLPDKFSILGYFIIFAASLYIFFYNKQLDKNSI